MTELPRGVSLLKIPLKLSLALVAGGFVIFGSYGAYELHAERNAQRVAIKEETELLARSLRVAVENALRDRQLTDIEEMVKGIEHVDPSVDVLIYEPGGRLIVSVSGSQPSHPILANTLQTALNSREAVFQLHPAEDPEQAVLATPLISDDGALSGGLVVVRPLLDMQHALQETQRAIVVSVLLFILTTSVLGLVLGAVYIGRPLNRMAMVMKEVRSGNLMSALPIDRKDEMGAIAAEFNTMVADLRAARRQLEEEAESRGHLQRALQEADKLITIGQLSAGLAHEIGSPLQILNGRARVLFARPQDPAETRRNAEILITQTDRITRIVDQLLRFARRRPTSTPRPDLRTTVSSVLDLLQYEARRRGVSLTFSCRQNLPPLLVDADGVQQIILNLVSNALAATREGGNVSVSLEPNRLSASNGKGETATVRLVVTDTGAGMSAGVLEHLFEPFFTTRASQGGTGLGLAVVKSLVTEHGGTVSVESQLGVGSRFIVDLPVHRPEIQQEVAL